MANRQECFVLLRMGWRPPLAEFAATMQKRFPELGRIAGTDAPPDSGMPGTLLVDGVSISMTIVNAPYPQEQLFAPVRLLNHIDPESLLANQLAYVLLAVEGPDIDVSRIGKAAEAQADTAAAFAALLTLTASAIAGEAPAIACFWADSWRLVQPEMMVEAGERVMEGDLPHDIWVSFAEVKGPRAGGGENRAMMSFGLRKFCGREVEVAGAPMSLAAMERVALQLCDRMRAGDGPIDYDGFDMGGGGRCVLRLAERFMRPRQPAVVAVPPDSAVDAETLELKNAKRGGIAGRLFGKR
ncbi:MAG: hypothetical protein AAF899_12815 [Pseudomonadota bacterium]